MDNNLIIAGVLALLIQYVIVYFAVYNATDMMRKKAKVQTELLIILAKKAGATEEEINNALTA